MATITHVLVASDPQSPPVDDGDWNANHTFVTAAGGVVLGREVGAGAGAVTEVKMLTRGIINMMSLGAVM